MDDPQSDQAQLEKTLAQFSLINRGLSRARHVLKKHVVSTMLQEPERNYHLVDLGAGACETAAWLLKCAARQGLRLHVTACDHDPRVVRYARRRYGTTPGLTILEQDIMDLDSLPPPSFVFANHLLHHLSDGEITTLLKTMLALHPDLILLNDIKRSWPVYAGYYLLTAFVRRDSFLRSDGLLSIRKGFRVAELKALAADAGFRHSDVQVQTLFPGRILLRCDYFRSGSR